MLLALLPTLLFPLLSSAARSHPARLSPGHQSLAARSANLQTFAGAVGNIAASSVTYDASLTRPYAVGSRQELDLATALQVSCDEQHNSCSTGANSGGSWTVGECDTQDEECKAAISSASSGAETSTQASTSSEVQATSSAAITAVSSATFLPSRSESEASKTLSSSNVEPEVTSSSAEPLSSSTQLESSAVISLTSSTTSTSTLVSAAPAIASQSSSATVSPSAVQEAVVATSSSSVASISSAKASTTSTASSSTSTSAYKSSYTGLQTGSGTFYGDSSSGNACLLPERSDLLFAAWPGATWNTAEHCGSCLRVTGPLGSVDVQVINECPECLEGSLDLSTTAFTKIGTQSDGIIPISWEFVSCYSSGLETSGSESFAWKSGSSANWAGIQPRHTDGSVASLAIKIDGVYTDIPRLNYNYYVQGSGFGAGPFDVQVTLDNGVVSEYSNVALNSVIGDA